jgi:hypothetical protein
VERAEHCGAAELHGTRISPVLLSNLGAHAQLGRSFAPGDDLPQRNRLIIISDRAWRTLYEEDRGVLGLSLMIDGQPYYWCRCSRRTCLPHGRAVPILSSRFETISVGRTGERENGRSKDLCATPPILLLIS